MYYFNIGRSDYDSISRGWRNRGHMNNTLMYIKERGWNLQWIRRSTMHVEKSIPKFQSFSCSMSDKKSYKGKGLKRTHHPKITTQMKGSNIKTKRNIIKM